MMQAALYIVATPIGNLADLTIRAKEVLQQVDCIAAENPKFSKRLLQHIDSKVNMISLNDHNERKKAITLLEQVGMGKSVALISDAGTPLISDPGYNIVKLAHQLNIKVIAIPGCCAAIAAISCAGIASNEFSFLGFLPAKTHARKLLLQQLQNRSETLIFYEAPHRILSSLTDLLQVFGADRQICMAREITKLFETIKTASITDLLEWLKSNPEQQQGEFVLIVAGKPEDNQTINSEAKKIIEILLAESISVKQTASITSGITNIKKNILYNYIIESYE